MQPLTASPMLFLRESKISLIKIKVEVAAIEDCEQILEIEQNSISYNTLKIEDIKTALTDENYKTFKVLLNDEIGYWSEY